ncbi:hypothetical protein CFP71_29570 [Amycolatopsis thailandensis]|uniref:Uncharacterized protein n=1 Tax=Amycolatopsis thailandensis TaxID=589330 RepID=A0A229RTH4_9PSEU|nr:hypothetical protein CFP71_29570 [Amycolatopsis thailandensis]
MRAGQASCPLDVHESHRRDATIVGNQDVYVLRWWHSLHAVAAKRPETGHTGVFAPVEQRALEQLIIGGRTAVKQHDSGQEPLPRPARSAAASDGPVRYSGGFEFCRSEDQRTSGQ